jgi:hypothetical protein
MENEPAPSKSPMVLVERRLDPWRQIDWQKFWLTLRAREWKSLALVPAGTGAPLDFSLTIAVLLARTGMMHLGVPIRVADATQVPLNQMMQLVEEVNDAVAAGELVLIALATTTESPISVSLAQLADSALLCVMLEQMAMADAKRTVQSVGTQKFIGSAVFRPTDLDTK